MTCGDTVILWYYLGEVATSIKKLTRLLLYVYIVESYVPS